jgi:D-alanyl-D-alanine carboxypeptidase
MFPMLPALLLLLPPGASEKVDELMAGMAGRPMPGVAIGVVKDGEPPLIRTAGLADVAKGLPISGRTIFRLASMTKSFTAIAVLQLAEQGKLGLDDPLAKYLPETAHLGPITVRHLLGHQAGIPDFVAIEEALRRPVEFEPGTRINYTNNGYLLLGRVIEKVSGLGWEEYLKQRIFVPAGMASTGYDKEKELTGRATGYLLSKNGTYEPTAASDARGAQAAGGLYSTIEDMLRWEEALRSGKLLRPATIEMAMAPATLAGGRKAAYGLGFMTAKYRGARQAGHGGDITGFNSYLARYPDHGLTVVVLSNVGMRPAGVIPEAAALAHKVADICLGEELRDDPPPAKVLLSGGILSQYAGRYRLEAPEVVIRNMGAELVIAVEGERLVGEAQGRKMPLEALSVTEFQALGSPATLTFVPSDGAKTPCGKLIVNLMGLREYTAVRVE